MINKKMMQASEMVIAIFRAEGHCLDYSIGSLDAIDKKIEQFRREEESADSMPATMTAVGIYVGETIRRTLGRGEWVEHTELDYSLDLDGVVANPIRKCMKRLDNGPADSVKQFVEAILAIANMPAEERRTSLKTSLERRLKDVEVEVCDE